MIGKPINLKVLRRKKTKRPKHHSQNQLPSVIITHVEYTLLPRVEKPIYGIHPTLKFRDNNTYV